MKENKREILSPHISIYKPQITSILSISHRLSGVFLYIGLLLFSWFLIAKKFSYIVALDKYQLCYSDFFTSKAGVVILFLWLLAFFFHMLNGVRHLCWDMGAGLEMRAVVISGIIVVISTIALTSFSWFYAYKYLMIF